MPMDFPEKQAVNKIVNKARYGIEKAIEWMQVLAHQPRARSDIRYFESLRDKLREFLRNNGSNVRFDEAHNEADKAMAAVTHEAQDMVGVISNVSEKPIVKGRRAKQ